MFWWAQGRAAEEGGVGCCPRARRHCLARGAPPTVGRGVRIHPENAYPVCGETLEPLARFVRKLPKDSNLAENGFPGLINQEFLGSFSTNHSFLSAERA